MPVMTKPKLGDVRYVITWICRGAMRESVFSDDDLVERMQAAERHRIFATDVEAKAWAEANQERDEYGAPRFEKQTFEREYDDVPAEWQQSEYHEWSDDAWQPLVF
jgi:hypothetical protein